jgi:class 3 adenylate cyclase/TolB-like protein
MAQEQRRLAAILVADIVGYSTLVAGDEAGTLNKLAALRRDVIDPAIGKHSGRLFKSMGDGFLVEFGSAVQAVTCARAIQEANGNGPLPLRIGVHVDDVVVQGDDLMGDGVNIAVRIEGTAEPGGVVVSRAVHDQVRDKLDLVFDDKGEILLKNLARPVHVYSVVGETSPARLLAAPAPGLAGANTESFLDRPALAVLPLSNLTRDEANGYLCEGLSEDLIDRLTRLRWLPVVARSSSFAFPSERLDPRVIGQRLRAKYVLEGRLQTDGAGFAVALRLSDASTGYSMWSYRVPLPADRSQDALDPVVAQLVGILDAKIDYSEQVRARGQRQNRPELNDLLWRGRWHLNRLTRTDSEIARKLFDQALELQPDSSEALIQATFCLAWSLWAQRATDDKIVEMRRLAHRAIQADPDDGRSYMLAGIAEMWLRRPDQARTLLERAIALNPSLSMAYAQLGTRFNLVGEPAAALEQLRTAQRLSPNDPHLFFMIGQMALSFWMQDKWTDAIEHADQSLIRRPGYWDALVIEINALVGSGDLAAAGCTVEELLAVKPNFTPEFLEWLPFTNSLWRRRLADGLAVAKDARASAR